MAMPAQVNAPVCLPWWEKTLKIILKTVGMHAQSMEKFGVSALNPVNFVCVKRVNLREGNH